MHVECGAPSPSCRLWAQSSWWSRHRWCCRGAQQMFRTWSAVPRKSCLCHSRRLGRFWTGSRNSRHRSCSSWGCRDYGTTFSGRGLTRRRRRRRRSRGLCAWRTTTYAIAVSTSLSSSNCVHFGPSYHPAACDPYQWRIVKLLLIPPSFLSSCFSFRFLFFDCVYLHESSFLIVEYILFEIWDKARFENKRK